jgi:hypothetical protein
MKTKLRTSIQLVATVLLCLWALWIQMTYRVPGHVVFVLLPTASLGVLGLLLVLIVNDTLAVGRGEGPLARVWRWAARASGGLVRAFVLYSLFLFANGVLDQGPVMDRESDVIEIVAQDVSFALPMVARVLPVSWADLRSWDRPGRVERLLLSTAETRDLWPGQPVTVQVRPGFFRIPWVVRVQHDQGRHLEAVLKLAPSAQRMRQQLVRFYIERRRNADAERAIREYFELHPDDYPFAQQMARTLGAGGRYREMLQILEPFVARKPSYEVYTLTALAMTKVGRKEDAVRLLDASIAMEPDQWWAYYFLGYAYTALGKPMEALAAFEKVKSIRREFPEVDVEIGRLRALTASQRSVAGRP